MKTTHHNRSMKCGTNVWRVCAATVVLALSAGADEIPVRGKGVTNDVSIVRRAVLFLRDQGVAVDHESLDRSRETFPELPADSDTFFTEGTPPESVLGKVCGYAPEYTWRRDTRSGRYTVCPATNALSDTAVKSMSVTNQTLKSLFADQEMRQYMAGKGVLLAGLWHRSKQGNDIYVDFDFAGGTFAGFLTDLARNAGQGICWDMKQGEPTIRALVGNRVVDRPDINLDFTAVKGGGLAQLAPVLRDAETGRLEDMLAAASPRKRSAIARELASRYLSKGDREKARAFFQTAVDDAAFEAERWTLRWRMLDHGLGYPTRQQAASPKTGQIEAFLADCDDIRARGLALSALLDACLNVEGEARALIEKVDAGGKDPDWIRNVTGVYHRRWPSSPLLVISNTNVSSRAGARTIIETRYEIKTTADGKLERHTTVTERTVGVETNKRDNVKAR